MKIIIDLDTNIPVGLAGDETAPTARQVLVEPPEDFDPAGDLGEWSWDGEALTRDLVAVLDRAKTARKARIKTEAERLIAALDWRLTRARERQDAGWATLTDTDAILAQREAIRRSSDDAEAAVDAMTDADTVRGFTWSVTAVVPTPTRLSHKEFSDLFTGDELAAILAATDTNAAMRAWWEKFKLASNVVLTDPATQAGVNALEIAGLIGEGRADEILAG